MKKIKFYRTTGIIMCKGPMPGRKKMILKRTKGSVIGVQTPGEKDTKKFKRG